MSAIRNDEQLATQRELLALVESIVESWKKQLLPHNPKNYAIYAEGAIEQAEQLRAEIEEYLERRKVPVAEATQAAPNQQATNVP